MITKKGLLSDFIKKNPGLLSFTFLAGLCNGICNLLIPVFIGKYYQLAFHTHSPRGRFFDRFLHLKDLDVFFILFGILILVKTVFTFLEKYLTGYSSEVFSKSLRENLFATQISFTTKAFERKSPGKYLLRYSGDLSAIQRYVMKGILRFTIDLLFLAFALILLVMIDLPLTMIVMAAFPFFFGMAYYLNKYLKRLTIKRRNIRSEMLAFVSSRLHALLTVKVFNRESIEEQKFNKNSEKLFRYGKRYFRLFGSISALFPLFLYFIVCGVLYYAHYQRMHFRKDFPPHEILIFIMVLINLLPILRRVLEVNMVWQAGNVSISKILRIFNAETEIKKKEEAFRFEKGRIEILNLKFSYPNGHRVFNGFSAIFPDGKITWLKGAQGSGKSTLLKIILGIYPADEGEILIDGQAISTLNSHVLRKNITLVSDEVFLLGRTVFEAVSYSRKEEKREKAEKILEKLKFSSNGNAAIDLDFQLEEGAKNLSAGQRKLLQIARALLTRKKIILLDEVFTGLDKPSRDRVCESLKKLDEKRTIVLVSNDQIPEGIAEHFVEVFPIQDSIT